MLVEGGGVITLICPQFVSNCVQNLFVEKGSLQLMINKI